MQLERILQSQGFGSRKECRHLIRKKEVKIAGQICDDPFIELDPHGLEFEIDDWQWNYAEKVYIAMHKPLTFECSHKARHNPSIYELLPEPLIQRNVQSVGRLDVDTSGLLLFSDDGQFIHALISPKRHINKSYRATLKHAFDATLTEKLLASVQLVDEPQPLRALVARKIDDHTLEIVVDQGKYHQVRRMIAAAGNRIEALHRYAIGELSLETDSLPQLEPQDWCYLKPGHLALLGYTA